MIFNLKEKKNINSMKIPHKNTSDQKLTKKTWKKSYMKKAVLANYFNFHYTFNVKLMTEVKNK